MNEKANVLIGGYVDLQGWPVLRVWHGSVYVRIPAELRRPIDGGCSCKYCVTHRDQVPSWDTLGIPLTGRLDTWTVHAPEWRPGDKISTADTIGE